MRRDADVAIVGGGPAGCAAALTLLAHTALSVILIEASEYVDRRVGETLAPSVQGLLEYLAVWDRFVADGHGAAYGMCGAWGSERLVTRDFLFTGQGSGWHLDRVRFDALLARAVAERGGTLLTAARVTDVGRTADGSWRLAIARADAGPPALDVSFIVDASGRRTALARRLGVLPRVVDQLVGVVGMFELPESASEEAFTIVEAGPDGWWYSCPLPDRRMVAAYMTDADLVQRRRAHQPAAWQALIEATEHTRARVAGARLCAPPGVHNARSQLLQARAGQGWVAAGDAAACFDPLAAMGIGYALSSGIHAARVALDVLAFDGSMVEQYSASMEQFFGQYLGLRQQYYLLEQRWADRPFWQRRHRLVR